MNKRIKELAVVAKEFATAKDAFGEYDISFDQTKFEQKFAELIVQECVGICDDVQRQYGQYTFTATKVKEEIKERFGVE